MNVHPAARRNKPGDFGAVIGLGGDRHRCEADRIGFTDQVLAIVDIAEPTRPESAKLLAHRRRRQAVLLDRCYRARFR